MSYKEPIQLKLYRMWWAGIDRLFPPECAGCGKLGARFCVDCISSFQNPKNFCQICGQLNTQASICLRCKQIRPPFVAVRTTSIYQNQIRNGIHRLKYHKDLGLGEVFAQRLSELVYAQDWDLDVVIPVALAKKRERVRGYNQAAVIGRPLAWLLNLPFQPHLLQRTRETQTQVGLNYHQRQNNVNGAFLASKAVEGKQVLLVDDVITSGATITAATLALLQGGAEAVYGVAIARVPID